MEPDWPVDAVEVGRVLGAWGVRGELKVRALSSQPEALFSSKRWYVDAPETPIARPGAAIGHSCYPRRSQDVSTCAEAFPNSARASADRSLDGCIPGLPPEVLRRGDHEGTDNWPRVLHQLDDHLDGAVSGGDLLEAQSKFGERIGQLFCC